MKNLECKECPYCWHDLDENGDVISRFPYCHWESRCPGDLPPCEEEDYNDEGGESW